nr:hypothetical protein [Tanacetum cinerariifolium]
DSYKVPTNTDPDNASTRKDDELSGRTLLLQQKICRGRRTIGNEDGNNACVSTSSTTFPTASANVATISQGTASAYIASQSNSSQIKFEDINQIDEDDMEEMDIK